MELTWVRQRMGIVHLDVMDTIFHSGDAWIEIVRRLSTEVSAVLYSE